MRKQRRTTPAASDERAEWKRTCFVAVHACGRGRGRVRCDGSFAALPECWGFNALRSAQQRGVFGVREGMSEISSSVLCETSEQGERLLERWQLLCCCCCCGFDRARPHRVHCGGGRDSRRSGGEDDVRMLVFVVLVLVLAQLCVLFCFHRDRCRGSSRRSSDRSRRRRNRSCVRN